MSPPSNQHDFSPVATANSNTNGLTHMIASETPSPKGKNQPLPFDLNGKKPATHSTSPAQDRRQRLPSSNSLNERLAQAFPSAALQQSVDSSRFQNRSTDNDRTETSNSNSEDIFPSQDPYLDYRSGNDVNGILADSNATGDFRRFGSMNGSLPSSTAMEGSAAVYHINPHSSPSGSPHAFKYFPDNTSQQNFVGNRSPDQSKSQTHPLHARSASSNQLHSSFSTSAYGYFPNQPLLGEYSKSSFVPKSQELPSFLNSLVTNTLDNFATRIVKPIVSISPESVGFLILCCLWYASSAITNNIGKLILNQFTFPVTLTFVQFGFVAGMCFTLSLFPKSIGGFSFSNKPTASWNARRKYSAYSSSFPTSNIRRPTRSIILTTLPLSLFQIAGHVFSSIAISRVPVSFAHTIKALSPLFTVMIYRFLYRVKYPNQVYVALLPLTLGVMLACSFEFNPDFIGFLCALGSCIIFVSQNIFSKKLLFKDSVAAANKPIAAEALGSIGYDNDPTSNVAQGLSTGSGTSSPVSLPRNKRGNFSDDAINVSSSLSTVSTSSPHLDKMNLLFYSSFMAFVLMFPLWLYSDGIVFLSPSFSFSDHHHHGKSPATSLLTLTGLFAVNGSTHFFQNFFAFSLLSITSPVTYSIASLVKRIFVIVASIVYFGQTVRPTQGVGIGLAFMGLWMYNRAKRESKNSDDESSALGGENAGGRSRGGGGGGGILPTVYKRDY